MKDIAEETILVNLQTKWLTGSNFHLLSSVE